VKVTKDMLDLAKHIVTQKTATFDPEKFEDHYEEALAELINQKRSGKTIAAKPRPKGDNVVDLIEALKKSISNERAAPTGAKGKRPSTAAGQREMLLPISGKRAAKAEAKKANKPATARARKRA
jgi:DNA end-binding protein Ku